MSKYPIIVFEGIEASGKSTSLKKIIKYLKTNKIKYVSFREPGGTNLSEKLRSLMLNKKSELSNKTDLFLLMASRSENIDKILKENYKKTNTMGILEKDLLSYIESKSKNNINSAIDEYENSVVNGIKNIPKVN